MIGTKHKPVESSSTYARMGCFPEGVSFTPARRPIIRGVVDEYLEGAGFRCCFAPIRCPACRSKAPSGVDLLRGKSAR